MNLLPGNLRIPRIVLPLKKTEKLTKEVLSLKECLQQKDAQINKLLQYQEQNLLLKENSSAQYEGIRRESSDLNER
jgi:hypothetical protein